MLKRIALLISLFFYLLAASGATVHFHFCKGIAQQVSFDTLDEKDCPFCSKSAQKHQSHCHDKEDCKDVLLEVKKIDTSYVSSKITGNDNYTPLVIVLPWLNDFCISQHTDTIRIAKTAPISLQYNDPLFLLNRNFRI